jgi:succinate dehydrogenase / fumarate reductase cytochrome b subunit
MKVESVSLTRYFVTSVGRKFLMAASGAVLVGFVIAHLLGNLQVFLGPEALNRYAFFLQSNVEFLWPARIFILAMVVVHIVTSVQLTMEARAARPVPYGHKAYIKATLASRTMAISGLMVLGFIVYHLLHFTFLKVHPEFSKYTDAAGRHDVYRMMVLSFQQPVISIAYIVPIFFLCAHLSHGISSMFQSLGANNVSSRPFLSTGGSVLAWAIFLGYASIPLACLFGLVKAQP